MRSSTRWFLLAAMLLIPTVADAQDPSALRTPKPQAGDLAGPIRLYLDCQVSGCDFDYLRTAIPWINYVRDRTDAQVYVLATGLSTGSGGSQITLRFLGQKDFSGVDDEISYTLAQNSTSDEDRREFTRILTLGMVRYLLRTAGARNLRLTYVPPPSGAAAPTAADPWNAWVFSVGLNGSANGESESKSEYLSANVSAGRVTEQWKTSFGFSGDRSTNEYGLGDGTKYKTNTHSYSGDGLIVRSISPHASAGIGFSGSSSTQSNIDLRARAAPTFEYNFFPYSEYSTRRLILSYSVGVNHNEYADTTIYDKISETLLDHGLSLSYSTRVPWGSANVGISAFNYLEDFKKNRLGINGGMSVRLMKGFSVYYNASYSRIHDQITLRKSGYTDEEILLRLRQLRTSYSYYASLGIGYTFGSIMNNVVNPRMGSSGGDECCH